MNRGYDTCFVQMPFNYRVIWKRLNDEFSETDEMMVSLCHSRGKSVYGILKKQCRITVHGFA